MQERLVLWTFKKIKVKKGWLSLTTATWPNFCWKGRTYNKQTSMILFFLVYWPSWCTSTAASCSIDPRRDRTPTRWTSGSCCACTATSQYGRGPGHSGWSTAHWSVRPPTVVKIMCRWRFVTLQYGYRFVHNNLIQTHSNTFWFPTSTRHLCHCKLSNC